MGARGLAGGCGRGATMSGLSLGVGRNRVCNLLKIGNTKGAAAVGVLAALVVPASNRTRLLNRDVGASETTMGRVVKVSPRRDTTTVGLATERGLRLVTRICNFSGGTTGTGTDRLVRHFSVRRFRGHGTGGLSNNRIEELDVTVTLVSRPGVLFLSRPALKLSIVTERDL